MPQPMREDPLRSGRSFVALQDQVANEDGQGPDSALAAILLPSIDQDLPVLIWIEFRDRRTICYARLCSEGESLFAIPCHPDQSLHPWRPQRMQLDPGKLVLTPDPDMNHRMYCYSDHVVVR